MRLPTLSVLALALACRRAPPVQPPRPQDVSEAVRKPLDAVAQGEVSTPSTQRGVSRPPVAVVRVRNVSAVPITIMTNPDLNEMLHTWRINVPADRSDRGLVYLNDPSLLTRVKLFPVDLPRCDTDAAAGFGGLGQTGTVVIAPGDSYEIGTWDGMLREEVVDHARGGVCLRESPAPPGRYRFHFDNPHNLKPDCQRALFRVPLERGETLPVIEIRCVPRPDGALSDEE